MTLISENNLKLFLTQNVDVSSYVLTEDLGTINRFNIISRFIHRDTLNSAKICENIFFSVRNRPLNIKEKNMLEKNLDVLQKKFLTSSDNEKVKNCRDTINKIKSQVLTPPKKATPNTQPNRNNERNGYVHSQVTTKITVPIVKAAVSPPPKKKKQQNVQAASVAPTIPTSTSKTVLALQKQDPRKFGVQLDIVNAISLNTRTEKTVEKEVIVQAPDKERIAKIEQDISDKLRKQAGDYVQLVHYPWDQRCKFYYVALKKVNENGFDVVKQVLVPAVEINQLVKERTSYGQCDIGALLREQRNKMGLYLEIK